MQKKRLITVLCEGMNYYEKKMILIYPDRVRVAIVRNVVKRTATVTFYFNEKAFAKKVYKLGVFTIIRIKSDLSKKGLAW